MKKCILFRVRKYIKSNNKTIKKTINWFFIILSFSILIYLFAQSNIEKTTNIILSMNLLWIIMGIVLMICSLIFESAVIYDISKFIIKKPIKKSVSYRSAIIGQYFSAITPMNIGGQPAQILELCKAKISKSDATLITSIKLIIYQSALSFWSLIFAAAYFFGCYKKTSDVYTLLIVGILFQTISSVLLILFLVNKKALLKAASFIINFLYFIKIVKSKKSAFEKFNSKIKKFNSNISDIFKSKKLIIKLYIYSSIQILTIFSIPFFIFKALYHPSFPIMEIITNQCVANTISSFTPIPGGAGTSEKLFLKMFIEIFPTGEIAAAMVVCRLITFYLNIVLGAIVYFSNTKESIAAK